MAKRKYFRQHDKKEGDSSNDVDLLGTPVKGQIEYHYANIAVINETSNGSYATPGLIVGGTFYPMLEAKSLPLGLSVGWSDRDLVVMNSEQLIIRVEGSTDGDELRFNAQGYSWVETVPL